MTTDQRDSTAQNKTFDQKKLEAVNSISFDLKITPTFTDQQLEDYLRDFGVSSIKKLIFLSDAKPYILDVNIDHFQKLREIGIDPLVTCDQFALGVGIEFTDGEKVLLMDRISKIEELNLKGQVNDLGYNLLDSFNNDRK